MFQHLMVLYCILQEALPSSNYLLKNCDRCSSSRANGITNNGKGWIYRMFATNPLIIDSLPQHQMGEYRYSIIHVLPLLWDLRGKELSSKTPLSLNSNPPNYNSSKTHQRAEGRSFQMSLRVCIYNNLKDIKSLNLHSRQLSSSS